MQASFDAPKGDEPLGLDLASMGKGQVWINGQSIGRYWTNYAKGNCQGCSYPGQFKPPKCQLGCGEPTQRWWATETCVIQTNLKLSWLLISPFHEIKIYRYHVPRSWLKPTGNLVVLFEELGGDPTRISLAKRSLATVCAQVSEYHPNIRSWEIQSSVEVGKSQQVQRPKVHLHCGQDQYISSIKFASFGTPLGTCGAFEQGSCHAPSSYSVLAKVNKLISILTPSYFITCIFTPTFFFFFIVLQECVGKQRCAVVISNANFEQDPCPNVLKRLSVEADCAPTTTSITQSNWGNWIDHGLMRDWG